MLRMDKLTIILTELDIFKIPQYNDSLQTNVGKMHDKVNQYLYPR